MDPNKWSAKGKVLIVDDSPLVCDMFSKTLAIKGYKRRSSMMENLL